jgi:hypothetical protein
MLGSITEQHPQPPSVKFYHDCLLKEKNSIIYFQDYFIPLILKLTFRNAAGYFILIYCGKKTLKFKGPFGIHFHQDG